MGNLWITDMTHFVGPGGRIPTGPAGRLADYFGSIVFAAARAQPGRWQTVPVRCRRRPARRPCEGRIEARTSQAAEVVEWICPNCGDRGQISNWNGTPWDPRRKNR
jgi:hypothetical protein